MREDVELLISHKETKRSEIVSFTHITWNYLKLNKFKHKPRMSYMKFVNKKFSKYRFPLKKRKIIEIYYYF